MNGSARYILRLIKKSDWFEFYTTKESAFETWKEALSKYCIQEEFSSKFKVLEVLGKGAYGTVHLVENKKTLERFAAKAFEKKRMKKSSKRLLLMNEIRILRRLDHVNIYKVYEVHEDRENVYVVLELIPGKELLSFMNKTKKFSRRVMEVIIGQLIAAVAYLEHEGIVHRDIKPENIMIFDDEEGKMKIKLCDFGLACEAGIDDRYEAGTPGYMAPEILHYKRWAKINRLTSKVDIFSIGCIMYQM